MSCIPTHVERIIGDWETVGGRRIRNRNWILIERYIAEEARLVAEGTYGYLYVEVTEKRAWRLSYADSTRDRKGPPTLVRMHPKTDQSRKRMDEFLSQGLRRWESRYLNYLRDPSSEPDWPNWRAVLSGSLSETSPLAEHWVRTKSEYEPAFNTLIEQLLRERGPNGR